MKKAKFKIWFYRQSIFFWLPKLSIQKLRWKDKFGTPRCEHVPDLRFEWFWFVVYGAWGDDDYWEQWLWLNKYCDGDYERAKKEWGWTDMNGKSTWIDYES